jgi:hypothetical protein
VVSGVSVEGDRWRKISPTTTDGNLISSTAGRKLCQRLRVTGVPRFLIIGPDCNFISFSACPQHPELKQMIIEQLAKMRISPTSLLLKPE